MVRDLIAEGKVQHFGMSEAGAETVRRAPAVQPPAAVQGEFSLFWRGSEADPVLVQEVPGIGFVPFRPLGSGFLTGKIDESTAFNAANFRNLVPRLAPRPARQIWLWSGR